MFEDRQTEVDWQFGEENGSWKPLIPPPQAKSGPASDKMSVGLRRRRRYVLRILAVIALLVAGMGVYYWRQYRTGLAHIRADIQKTIALENEAWQGGNHSLADKTIDPRADQSWMGVLRWTQRRRRQWAGEKASTPTLKIKNLELDENLALVKVLVTNPGMPWMPPYYETRFYRRVGDHWLRTSPVVDFWGTAQTIETNYFRFEFRQRDAAPVQAVLAGIDQRYEALRRNAGLASPSGNDRLTVKIAVRREVLSWSPSEATVTVPSPGMQAVPVRGSKATELRQTITYALARRVVDEAIRKHGISFGWELIVDGLHLCQGRGGRPLSSAWRYHVQELLQEQLKRGSKLHLDELAAGKIHQWAWADRWVRMSDRGRWVRLMAAEAIIEYGLTTYGQERLPALVRALGEYDTWNALIPAVFDVGADEFEAGWQRYLSSSYPVTGEACSMK